MTSDQLDVVRDTAALIHATRQRDAEAVRVILDHADNRAVAEALALIVANSIGATLGDGYLTDLCTELRNPDRERDS